VAIKALLFIGVLLDAGDDHRERALYSGRTPPMLDAAAFVVAG
jgi:hypothetical protein